MGSDSITCENASEKAIRFWVDSGTPDQPLLRLWISVPDIVDAALNSFTRFLKLWKDFSILIERGIKWVYST